MKQCLSIIAWCDPGNGAVVGRSLGLVPDGI